MIETIKAVNAGLRNRFPAGHEPYRIMTRLLEEAGELAQQVNLFEDPGAKQHKMGEPRKAALADEVKGVLIAAFQVTDYYDAWDDLSESFEAMRDRLIRDGYLKK